MLSGRRATHINNLGRNLSDSGEKQDRAANQRSLSCQGMRLHKLHPKSNTKWCDAHSHLHYMAFASSWHPKRLSLHPHHERHMLLVNRLYPRTDAPLTTLARPCRCGSFGPAALMPAKSEPKEMPKARQLGFLRGPGRRGWQRSFSLAATSSPSHIAGRSAGGCQGQTGPTFRETMQEAQ